MAYRFSQFPNGAIPVGAMPRGSFIGEASAPVDPEIPVTRIRRGSTGLAWNPPLEELLRAQIIDTDDAEVILAASMAFVEGELWRN